MPDALLAFPRSAVDWALIDQATPVTANKPEIVLSAISRFQSRHVCMVHLLEKGFPTLRQIIK